MGRKMIDENNDRRITEWLDEVDVPWLQKEKERIEKVSGEECEILNRLNDEDETVYALHYKNGYWKRHYATYDLEFVHF